MEGRTGKREGRTMEGQDDGRGGRTREGRAGKDEERIRERGADFCGIILKELFLTLHTTKVVGFLLQPLLRS